MLLEQFINGLSIGSVYALIALGYSMVYGVVKLINFAHADIIMVGSYMVYFFGRQSGLPDWLNIILSITICAAAGLLVNRLAYSRLLKKDSPRISLLITAMGVSLFLQKLFEIIFTSGNKTPYNIFANMKNATLFNVGISVVIMVLLNLLVLKTRMGKAMRATSEDTDAAKLMGINTNFVIAVTFAIGSALAGVAAIIAPNQFSQVYPSLGSELGIKAFVAAVLGGIGNIPGAMVGGYLLGIVETIPVALGASTLSNGVVFGVLIIVLLLRPQGLLGKKTKEKV